MCRTPFQRSDMQSTDLMKLIIRDEGAIVFCPHRCGFEGKVEDLLRHLLQCPLFNWREEWMRLSGSPGCTKLNVGSMLPLILNKLISLTQTAGTDEEITELLDFFFNKYIPHVSPDGDFCRDAGCRHENCIEQHKVQWLNADTTVVRVIVHVMLEMISRKGRVDFSSRGFRQFLHRRSYYVAENWWDVFYYIPGGVSLLSKVLTYELRNLSYALRDPNELQDSSNLCRVNNLLIRMDLRGLSGLLTPEVIDALINYLTHYIRCYDPQLFVVCKAHVGFASVFKLLLSAYKRLHSPNDVVRQRVDKIVRGLIKGLKVWSTEEWGKELSDESFQSFFENILECLEIVLGLCSTDHKWDVKTCDCFMHVLQLARTKAMLKGIVTGEPSAIRTRLDFVTSEFEDNRPLQPSLKRFCCNGARASK